MSELPLTPIERAFYHDHRASHPSWLRAEYYFDGTFSREAFTRAWAGLGERHPMATATVRLRRFGRPVWRLGSALPELVWHEGPPVARDVGSLHDLSEKSGLRGTVSVVPGKVTFAIDIHHAVADGLALHFIADDLFILYARECGQAVVPLPVAALDRRRGAAPLKASVWLRQLPWISIGVAWGMLLSWQKTLRLEGTGGQNAPRDLPARALSPEETVRLRRVARAAGANLNELVIRDVQAALGVWLQRHQAGAPPQAWTRIMVPVYVGAAGHHARCFANTLGMGLIERRVKSLGRRPRLLQRAHEDMEFIRSRGLAHSYRCWMWVLGCIPGGIVRACQRPVARSTLMVSNLGNIYRTGQLVRRDGRLTVPGAAMTGFAGWGPCRPGTGVFVLVGSYQGRQTYCVSYDPTALSLAETEDFADELERQTRKSLAGE